RTKQTRTHSNAARLLQLTPAAEAASEDNHETSRSTNYLRAGARSRSFRLAARLRHFRSPALNDFGRRMYLSDTSAFDGYARGQFRLAEQCREGGSGQVLVRGHSPSCLQE